MRTLVASVLVIARVSFPDVFALTSGETLILRMAVLSMVLTVMFFIIVFSRLGAIDKEAKRANAAAANLSDRTDRLEQRIQNE